MITSLTKEQEIGIIEWREYCLKTGRDTGKINKKLTEESWNKFYKILGFEKPVFWYCQSPLQAQIIINIFQEIVKIFTIKDKGANIRDNIRANIEDNIWENIGENIEANIGDNIEDNIWENIEDNIWENIGENIRENIRENICANIRENIWANIRDNIRANIRDNIRANIEDNIWENIKKTNFKFIETYSWCQHDIAWIGYCLFYEKYGLIPSDKNFEIMNIWNDLAQSCGWCYTFKNIVFVCEKPCKINLNSQGRLHKDGGMSLEYSDGYGLWMLNGVRVPKELVETPKEKLDIEFFKKEKNADVKAEFIRKFGIERMTSLGEIVETYDDKSEEWERRSEYQLINMGKVFERKSAMFLKMKNQSTGIWHLEGVSPECKTIKDALNYRYGSNIEIQSIK